MQTGQGFAEVMHVIAGYVPLFDLPVETGIGWKLLHADRPFQCRCCVDYGALGSAADGYDIEIQIGRETTVQFEFEQTILVT